MRTRTALLTVYHKDGITEFATELRNLGITLYASGGTAKHLKAAGLDVTDVATLVGEAILGHRVVTLSREVHAGLLSRSLQEDIDELERLGIPRIDMVCADFYPLQTEIAKEGSTRASVIETTDIGGPTAVRSGVKGGRLAVCDPKDRAIALAWLKAGEPDDGTVEKLAAKGEFVIAKYCMTSAAYLSNGTYMGIFGRVVQECKYGENGQQNPAHLFSTDSDDLFGLDKFVVIEGTPPSYNNYADIDRMLQTATHIASAYLVNSGTPTMIAVGVKHGNPCGAAIGSDPLEVLRKMMEGDPLAIFGGLIMTSFNINESMLEVLSGKMLDGVVAPDISQGAIDKLRRRGDKCRFIMNPILGSLGSIARHPSQKVKLLDFWLDRSPRFRHVRGGFLVQPNYTFVPHLTINEEILKYGQATKAEEVDMMLGWAIGSTSNSNTVVLVKDQQLLGNGVGQQDRVGAAGLALTRAMRSGHDINGAVAMSDSFFAFPDAPELLINAGVKAIITTSGSIRDQETIDLCQMRGVTLYMMPDKSARGFFGH